MPLTKAGFPELRFKANKSGTIPIHAKIPIEGKGNDDAKSTPEVTDNKIDNKWVLAFNFLTQLQIWHRIRP